jgi:hypothetical protein
MEIDLSSGTEYSSDSGNIFKKDQSNTTAIYQDMSAEVGILLLTGKNNGCKKG